MKHWWFSGRMLACHAGGPGSIPGQCICFCDTESFVVVNKVLSYYIIIQEYIYHFHEFKFFQKNYLFLMF